MSALADALRALMPFAKDCNGALENLPQFQDAVSVLQKHAPCGGCEGSGIHPNIQNPNHDVPCELCDGAGWTPASVEEAIARAEEQAIDAIANHSFQWCRARLFHALAGAYEQGKLREVLDEIDILDTEQDHFEFALVKLGWARERPPR